MWIYETQRFKDQVDEYSLRDFVEARRDRIDRALTRAQASKIARPYAGFLVTKKGNLRLIGGVEKTDGVNEVFVWYCVLKRGDAEYKDFRGYSRSVHNFLIRSDLSRWFAEQTTLDIEARRPEDLPSECYAWLQPIAWIFANSDQDDVMIFETSTWLRAIDEIPREERAQLLRLVEELEVRNLELESLRPIEVSIPEVSKYRLIAQRTSNKVIFLLGISRAGDSIQIGDVDPLPLGDDAMRHARRSYPTWVLAEPELWYAIENNDSYNLALSPEEQQLLRRIAGQTSNGSELPMFINGQAGSGKSTMLAYVFAGLCKMRQEQNAYGKPLYITYNRILLDKAKQTTRRLLDAHYDSNRLYADINLDELFISWREYLVSLLPAEERQRFNDSTRVDFNDFLAAWEGKRGKLPPILLPHRSYSAEQVWYVIRSLIKGSDSDDDLTPEDYEAELTRDERTIALEEFTEIYESFYTWYRDSLREKGLWDDQDLTQAVLKTLEDEMIKEPIAALVIDEAQDFTRRELRLISRATLYSDYKIEELGYGVRPPIIFAGDPLQTLSPTGFRWGAVKAGIYEELQGLFGDRAEQPVFSELLNNYRSLAPIVRLANTVQLWRAVRFGISDIQPQEAWNSSPNAQEPEKFILDELDESDFIKFADQTVLIVPCEEGGEIDFVKNDATLSKMFPEASETNPPPWVFSAAGIKGLEYDKVVLYKFGEAMPSPVNTSASADDHRDLQSEYFFNKLYVAITRPNSHLYIADTLAGDEKLWTHFNSAARERLLKEALARPDLSFEKEQLGTLEEAITDISGVQELNPSENARRIYEYARDSRSSRKMRQAASAYRRAKDLLRADECDAWAFEYEGDVESAGKKFESAGKMQDAWRCFWAIASWNNLSSIAAIKPPDSALEDKVVRFMISDQRNVGDLLKMSEALTVALVQVRPGLEAWKQFARVYKTECEKLVGEAESEDLRQIADFTEGLHEVGFVEFADLSVDLQIRSGNRARAKQILARLPRPLSAERAQKMFQLVGAPAGLIHLAEAQLWNQICECWDDAGCPTTPDWVQFVEPALGSAGRSDDQIKLLIDSGQLDRARDEFASAGRRLSDGQGIGRELALSYGRKLDGVAGVEYAKSIVESGISGLGRLEVLVSLAQGIAQTLEGQDWRAVGDQDRNALVFVSDEIHEVLRSRKFNIRVEDVPAIGALHEMARYSLRAHNFYGRYIDDQNLRLRDYCRRRYLVTSAAYIAENRGNAQSRQMQQDQVTKANTWKLDSKQSEHKLRSQLDAADSDRPVPAGQAGSVRWALQGGSDLLEINIDNGSVLALGKISLVGNPHRASSAEISEIDGGLRLTAGDSDAGTVVIEVSLSPDLRIGIVENGEQLGEYLVAIGADGTGQTRRPKPTGRTQPSKPTAPSSRQLRGSRVRRAPELDAPPPVPSSSIQAYKLAEELGVSVKELADITRRAGVPNRRGNQKFNSDEVLLIREVHKRKQK